MERGACAGLCGPAGGHFRQCGASGAGGGACWCIPPVRFPRRKTRKRFRSFWSAILPTVWKTARWILAVRDGCRKPAGFSPWTAGKGILWPNCGVPLQTKRPRPCTFHPGKGKTRRWNLWRRAMAAEIFKRGADGRNPAGRGRLCFAAGRLAFPARARRFARGDPFGGRQARTGRTSASSLFRRAAGIPAGKCGDLPSGSPEIEAYLRGEEIDIPPSYRGYVGGSGGRHYGRVWESGAGKAEKPVSQRAAELAVNEICPGGSCNLYGLVLQ